MFGTRGPMIKMTDPINYSISLRGDKVSPAKHSLKKEQETRRTKQNKKYFMDKKECFFIISLDLNRYVEMGKKK